MNSDPSRKRTLCFAAPTVYTYFQGKGFGGAELQIIQLSRMFVKAGYRVVILTNDYGQPQEERREGIEIYKTPLSFLGGSKFWFLYDSIRFVRFLIKLSPDYCFVKIPNVVLFFVALAAKFNNTIKPVKIFALDHDYLVDGHDISDILYRRAIKWTDLFIFQTEHQKKQAKAYLNKDGVVIRNVFNPPSDEEYRNKTEKDIDVLWIGDFHPNKCPEHFYEIAKNMPQYRFCMIAKSVPPQYAELHKSITSLSNVLYLGRVPFQETQKIFERSKVFINTSSVEGFPNCFLQAWWSKIPVVSLTFTCDGLLEDKGIGFVSGSIPKMCETLKTLLDNQELRDKYGSQEAKYLAENHLPESILGKYQSFLDL